MNFKFWLENIESTKVVDSKGRPKRVFHGTPNPYFKNFKLDAKPWNRHEAGRIGIWFTDDPNVARDFSHRTDTEYYTIPGRNWDDGEPMRFPRDKHYFGKVHTVYLKIENPKVYDGKDGFEAMMDDRDKFVKYIDGPKGGTSWRQRYISMNTSEANTDFVSYLKSQGHDGIIIRNTKWDAVGGKPSNQYVVFSPEQIKNAF